MVNGSCATGVGCSSLWSCDVVCFVAFRRLSRGRFGRREGLDGVSGASSRSGRGPKLTRRELRAMARLCLCGPQGTEFSLLLGRDGVCGTSVARIDVDGGSRVQLAGAVVGGGS